LEEVETVLGGTKPYIHPDANDLLIVSAEGVAPVSTLA
jgi:hypothetical protein